AIAIYPGLARRRERARVAARAAGAACELGARAAGGQGAPEIALQRGLLVRVEELEGLLASWQTIGGCGAGAGAASSAGLKWVGRNVTGGLFNVQEQVSYSTIGSRRYPGHNFFG